MTRTSLQHCLGTRVVLRGLSRPPCSVTDSSLLLAASHRFHSLWSADQAAPARGPLSFQATDNTDRRTQRCVRLYFLLLHFALHEQRSCSLCELSSFGRRGVLLVSAAHLRKFTCCAFLKEAPPGNARRRRRWDATGIATALETRLSSFVRQRAGRRARRSRHWLSRPPTCARHHKQALRSRALCYSCAFAQVNEVD